MVFQNNVLSGAGGSGTAVYKINQSIRFDDASEHFMYSPTPSSSKDFTTTATISLWFKLGDLKAGYLAGAFYGNNNRYNILAINASGQLLEYDRVGGASTSNGTGTIGWTTNRVFRDTSAWYHAVFVWDTTNAVQSERFRLYINGVRETDFATDQALGASELVYWFGKSTPTTLGAYFTGTGYADTYYFDGYMAEMHGVDGTALDQDSFGEFNSSGIWVPKEYTGGHGTDGFYIKGADASALGTNSAANGNNFTLNGISADDQQPDSPTNNHAVFNPIEAETLITYSEGNLAIAYSGSSGRNAGRSTIQIPASTDAFFEMVMTSNLGSGVDFFIGIEDGTAASDNSNSIYNNAYIIREDGSFLDQGSRDYSYGTSFTNTDVIGVWRKANGDLVFYKNGTAMNSGTPAKTGLTGAMFFVAGPFNGASGEARFASSKWTNKPSGVTDSMALNTSNLGS